MKGESQTPVSCRFSFHGSMPVWAYGFFSIPIVTGCAMLFDSGRFPLSAALWCILLPVVALTDREREVDAQTGIIITRWKLYRLITLWKCSEPISNYESITCRRTSDSKYPSTAEMEWIALVRPSGKFRYIRYFYARKNEACPEAQGAARLLSEVTGLPIQNFPDKIFHRRAPGVGSG